MPEQVTGRAYAKVNLALAVGPALPKDHPKAGFHPIASWMACVDLFDEVTVRRLRDDAASIHRVGWAKGAPRESAIDWAIEDDLAVRAHRLLERHARRKLPISMELVKRTPVGGGLGGGSSDAATALRCINELFDLRLGSRQLAALGAGLGSDVPFFVDDENPARPALVTGLGESVERLGRCRSGLVLGFPPFGCATGAVYRAFDGAPTAGADVARVRECIRAADESGRVRREGLFNDLAGASAALSVHMQELAGGPPLLSGSGSSVFILCDEGREEEQARVVRAGLERRARELGEGWLLDVKVWPTRLV